VAHVPAAVFEAAAGVLVGGAGCLHHSVEAYELVTISLRISISFPSLESS